MGSPRKSLLDLSTRDAVSRIAGRHLAAAAKGLSRLENSDDAKGLHAFRVAIRRLRSLMRAYRPWIGRMAGRKLRRGLRELTRGTNAARDAEVQLAWLAGRFESLARDGRPGCTWLMRRLRDQKRRVERSAGARLARDFSDVARRLRNRIKDAEELEPSVYRVELAGLVVAGAANMRARIASIAGADDEEGVHRSRIQVKRLRYLVEPLRKELPEARSVVRALRKLQDLLGELHDLHVLEEDLARHVEEAATEKARRLHALAVGGRTGLLAREQRRDERVGLVALAARAREERDRRFARLQRDWLGHADSLLKDEVDALLRALAQPS
jgi:CHAD domain-containing protein